MDKSEINDYKSYTFALKDIIYNSIAIKLASFIGFKESLISDQRISEIFPLLPILLESLHVDCVITMSKLIEGKRGDKTIQKYLDFLIYNQEKISRTYPKLTEKIIRKNKEDLSCVGDLINSILYQRDKYYAHADNEYFLKPNNIHEDFPNTYEELAVITRTLQSIISCHIEIITNSKVVCISDLVILNTTKTIDKLISK